MKNKFAIATHPMGDSGSEKFAAARRFRGRQFSIGVDVAIGDDYTAVIIYRRPTRWERLARRLRLSKATWEIKIVEEHYEGYHT